MEFLGKDINERNHCSLTSCKLNIFLPKSSWDWRPVQVSQPSLHPKGSQFTSLLVGSGEVALSFPSLQDSSQMPPSEDSEHNWCQPNHFHSHAMSSICFLPQLLFQLVSTFPKTSLSLHPALGLTARRVCSMIFLYKGKGSQASQGALDIIESL